MPDFSLVPVDHQPDFGDVSFVPVDHDPFSADGATQQVQAQSIQSQSVQTPPAGSQQPPVMQAGQPDVGIAAAPLTDRASHSGAGDSYPTATQRQLLRYGIFIRLRSVMDWNTPGASTEHGWALVIIHTRRHRKAPHFRLNRAIAC